MNVAEPSQSVNYGCLPITANSLLFSDLPKIIYTTCPQNFADELIILTRELGNETDEKYFE